MIASGLGIPTAFAFGAGHTFESDDGKRLYASESGAVYAPTVVSMTLAGAGIRTEAVDFPAPLVGLATHAGWVYVGASDGHVWRRFRAGS